MKNNKKILIIQFRTDYTEKHEQGCFLEEFPELKENIIFYNLVKNEKLPDTEPVSGVIFCGSGEFYLSRGDGIGTWRDRAFALLEQLSQKDIPTLGICFGFQMIALQHGASIINDESMRESGTFLTTMSVQGHDNPLYHNIPKNFPAQFGHKETVINFPKNLIPLSSSERVICNSFHVENKKMWGVLFHPELNKKRTTERLQSLPSYAGNMNMEEIIKNIQDTPDTTAVLHNFIQMILIND